MNITSQRLQRLAPALTYNLIFTCFGLDMALVGPVLPELARQTGSTTAAVGLLFFTGALGFTFGTAASGRLLERLPAHRLMGLAHAFTTAFLLLIPLAPVFPLLLALYFLKGFSGGIVNTGANALLVWTYRDKVGPYMNALHFSFGVGAFVSPLVLGLIYGAGLSYRWAYWGIALLSLAAVVRMLTLPPGPRSPGHAADGTTLSREALPYGRVAAAALFLFFYVGAEIAFAGWIYTYAVTLNLAGPVEAAYLTSAFWFTFTVGRLISIFIINRVRPARLIGAALLVCLALLGVLVAFPGQRAALWLATAGFGLVMGPIYPVGVTLMGQSLTLTARVTSLIMLGDSVGGMLLPWLAGWIIAAAGPLVLPLVILVSLGGNVAALAGMVRQRRAAARTAAVVKQP